MLLHLLYLLPALLSLFASTVPQQGKLLITTEFGKMLVEPNEICVIQVRAVLSGKLGGSEPGVEADS